MASGKSHDFSIYLTSPIVGAIASYHVGLELGLITGAAHLFGGVMLSPDLDLISRPFKRWGFLKIIWIPYQQLIPRHRHWLSHGVIVGSSLRLVYLAAWRESAAASLSPQSVSNKFGEHSQSYSLILWS